MSLINDALRRAKQVQQEAHAPLAGPPLRPVDPPVYVRHGVGIIVPVSMTLVALLGLLLLWQIYQRRDAIKQAEANSQATTPAQEKASAQPQPPIATPSPQTSGKPTVTAVSSTKHEDAKPPVVTPTLAAANPTPVDSGAAATLSSTNAASQTSVVSNAAPAVEPAVPKPEPLRLQGIVFNPRRPSTVINGRTLFLGDRIREFRITAIRQDSVTLVGGGRTNVLSLEQ
jgi:hypothetical protein